MRIASFNVENLFERAKAFNLEDKDAARVVLEQYARLNDLFNQPAYSKAAKAEMVDLLGKLGLAERDDGGEFALLRQNRGRLLRRPLGGGTEVIASGRSDWVGWVELKNEPVNELATQHTAMVIRDVGGDVQAVVEADNRIALKKFSGIALQAIDGQPYEHVMLIDGNDDRGIDVALMTRSGYEIVGIASHVDDTDAQGEIFSRDCPEFTVTTPAGERLVLLVNHLKSKGFGTQGSSNTKRRRQARRVAQIYRSLTSEGQTNVIVLGDFNDTPDSAPLAPLLAQTDLRDITTHPSFKSDGRPGTFANGAKGNKIDYILLSPALFPRVTGGAIFRKGVWGGKQGTLFPHYPTITRPSEAASDHAAIYADIS
jgi:endonuclease/exonuclease/phosphatase family metal-dependent hydrolase